uniref:C-type lectin domain-containing protein n=1 Tax=Oryzias latipes TaxID=8090 RepID=A0A3B3HWB1_ORYLA
MYEWIKYRFGFFLRNEDYNTPKSSKKNDFALNRPFNLGDEAEFLLPHLFTKKMKCALLLFWLPGHFCLFTCQMYDYYFVNMNLSWTEAQQHCKTHYTDLATVTNRKDLDKLRNMQRSSMAAWIGLYYEAGTNETFHWSLPGVEFNKTNTCVALCEHFKWVDIDCTTNHYFLCFNSKK